MKYNCVYTKHVIAFPLGSQGKIGGNLKTKTKYIQLVRSLSGLLHFGKLSDFKAKSSCWW